ncbi:MAG: phage major capsid protein [Planctomycetes bacterium]|nr:phage major capsid protein [Planctomycetota bacterium]
MAGANAETVAEIIRELWEQPFVEALARVSWLYRFFGASGGAGDGLRWKVHYAGNSSSTSYGLDDTPPAAGHQAYERAHLPWKRNWITISIDGLLAAMTQGEGGFLEAESSELSGALRDFVVALNTQFWGDGTGNDDKDIDGIEAAISDSGSYAGIARSGATWWQSYEDDASNDPLDVDMVKAHLDALLGDSERGIPQDGFVMVTSRTDWRNLGNSIETATGNRRLQTAKLEGGFTAIMVDETPVLWAPDCAQGTCYGITREDWRYRVLQAFKVEPLGRTRDSNEAYVKHYSNLQCRSPKRQSKIINLGAS